MGLFKQNYGDLFLLGYSYFRFSKQFTIGQIVTVGQQQLQLG